MDRFRFITNSPVGEAGKNFDELPRTSGVYCFTEETADIGSPLIYIGKAINIRDRVKNHFQQPNYKDNLFINKVNRIGYLETNSEIEALILEANLIKKHQPKYNVVWRDDKNFFYVAISKDEKPIIYITHQPSFAKASEGQGHEYIGPFVEGTALKKTLRFLRKAFPYYTSKMHSKLKCTYCHLGLCPGPEPFENPPTPKASEGLREYRRNIKKLTLILQGKRSAVLNSLKQEMRQLSKSRKFEEAAKIRDKIYNLQQVMSHTHVISQEVRVRSDLTRTLGGILGTNKPIHRIECYDISNIQGKFATGSMIVSIDGVLAKNEYKKFKIHSGDEPNDIAMLKEILQRRFSHPEWPYPEVILIDGGKAQLNIAIKVREQFHRIVPLVVSIAKGKQELFIERRGGPIPLKNLPQEVYNLIKQLDDEAHRFAITYHKKLRRDKLLN